MTAPRLVALLVIALASAPLVIAENAFAAPNAGELETARALFKEGRSLREKGDLKAALEKFKAADALAGTPVTAVELGRTHMMLGQLLEAREAFLRVAQIPLKPNESANLTSARAESVKLSAELVTRIPSIVLKLTGVPAGKTPKVTVDGALVPGAALDEARKVDPGKHVIVASVDNGPQTSVEVDVKEGEIKPVAIEVKPEAAPAIVPPLPVASTTPKAPPPPPPPIQLLPKAPDTTRGASPLTWVGFGLAGAGIVVGSITGALALGKASSVKNECPNKDCGPKAQSDIDTSKTLGSVATISFVAAGVGAALGVVGLLTHGGAPEGRASRMTFWVGAGSAGIVGSF